MYIAFFRRPVMQLPPHHPPLDTGGHISHPAGHAHRSANCRVPFTENNSTKRWSHSLLKPLIFHSPHNIQKPNNHQDPKFVGSQNSFVTKVSEFYGDLNNFKTFQASLTLQIFSRHSSCYFHSFSAFRKEHSLK